MSEHRRKRGEPTKARVYEIIIDTDVSGTTAARQTEFMGDVFAALTKANITGHGLNIVLKQEGDR